MLIIEIIKPLDNDESECKSTNGEKENPPPYSDHNKASFVVSTFIPFLEQHSSLLNVTNHLDNVWAMKQDVEDMHIKVASANCY